ncbi:MAG: Phosphoglycerate mutase [Ilumatobacteraceae bacterium]|nr:Phosphoglycerate mutase [Ilumatobacteraceae bacterium]MCU1388251.1 Phosphoglycerate mutase [Ilumatobacteraceae bacterium]
MTRLYLVRHGRAAAGWDTHPDPGLDSLGAHQAEQMADRLAPFGPLDLISSPLQRCRETAAVLGARWSVEARIEPLVAEIPSPEGIPMGERVAWLRAAMAGTWTALGPRYTAFRDGVAGCLLSLPHDTVIASHFVAINAAIGAAVGDDAVVIRSLDNCSITVIDVVDGALHLVEGGHEADTLIR